MSEFGSADKSHAARRVESESKRPIDRGHEAVAPSATARGAQRNALTVDVEYYFQVGAFAATISRADWESLPRRV